MIFDWYRGGDWGGIPVCRLGHIMADLVNASYILFRFVTPTGTTGAPQYKRGNGNAISFASAPNAEPSWWDGLPVGSGIIRDNYRAAFALLEGFTEDVDYGFVLDDGEFDTIISLEELGIADLTEDTLERPQQAWVWARLRTAMEKCRYLRKTVIFSGEWDEGDTGASRTYATTVSTDNEATVRANEAVADAWGAVSYSWVDTSAPYLKSFVSAQYYNADIYGNPNRSSALVFRARSVIFDFRLGAGALDLPVARADFAFWKPAIFPWGAGISGNPKASIETSEGTITDGTEFRFDFQDSAQFDIEDTVPFDFPAGTVPLNTPWKSVGAVFYTAKGGATPVLPIVVYDIDGDPAS